MSKSKYNFYMQQCDKNGVVSGKSYDLEKDFEGLRYLKCTGLDAVGKPKNIYTESYHEAVEERVYMPSEEKITREPIDVVLSLLFVGEGRTNTMLRFNNFIKGGFRKYWDTARNKSIVFYIDDAITVKEETFKGSNPYIQIDYKLKCIKGYADNSNI